MGELLTGSCPNCGSKLKYESGDRTVTCFACDCTLSVSELGGAQSSSIGAPVAFAAAFTGFDNPESGVVFIENFFETYDWKSYQLVPEILVPEISDVINNNKMKNGASPESWYLDFMALYVPVSKKFDGLDLFAEEIKEKFNPVDPAEILEIFDNYRTVAQKLKDEEENIYKALDSAIKFAERFNLASDKLGDMKSKLSALKSRFSTICTKKFIDKKGIAHDVVVDHFEELPAYTVAKNAYAQKMAAEYSARGINADEIYQRAVEAYNANNTANALTLFESIRNYSDSALYIQKINQYFEFVGLDENNKNQYMYRFAGKHFIYKMEDYTKEALNVKKLTKKVKAKMAEAGQGEVSALSLYEVVNGVPADEPVIRGIDKIITCYGTKLFFFKSNKGVAAYDIKTGIEIMVDEGTSDLYLNDAGNYEYGIAHHAPYLYIKKKYRDTLKGCLSKFKKNQVVENELNPYTLVLVDMSNNTTRVVVGEMTDIKLRKDDKLFFNLAYKAEKKIGGIKGIINGCLGKKVEETKSRLMVCDIAKGITTQVLDEDCEIHAVKDDTVVYTLWKPNDLNEEIHAYDMASGVDTLIEENVYEFFSVIDDKIYYTIGNDEFRPLVRANFDGSDREQIMQNVENVIATRAGWLYVLKGTKSYNSMLLKVRADGKERIVVCTGLKLKMGANNKYRPALVKFVGSEIYYVDANNSLKCVRADGKNDRVLAQKVTNVFPAEDGLYYCREEAVTDTKDSLSIYKMDRDGLNIRKVVFHTNVVQNDPISNSIYFSKHDNIRYKVYKPGKEKKAHYEFLNITKFYAFQKASAGKEATAPELVLTLGLPGHKKPEGCIGKFLAKFKKDFIYEEAPIVHSYKNRGLTDAQIMAQEDDNIPIEKNFPKWMPKAMQEKLSAAKAKASSLIPKGFASKKANAGSRNRRSIAAGEINKPYAIGAGAALLLAILLRALAPRLAILKILIAVAIAAAALIGFGIIPLIKKSRFNSLIAIWYIIASMLLIMSGIQGLSQGNISNGLGDGMKPGYSDSSSSSDKDDDGGFFKNLFATKGSTFKKALEVGYNETDEETYKSVKKHGYVYFKFVPNENATYAITAKNVDDSDYSIYLYDDADEDDCLKSAHHEYYHETEATLSYKLNAGTEYYIKVYIDDREFCLNIQTKATGETSDDAINLTLDQEVSDTYDHLDYSTSWVWFKYTPTETAYYKFNAYGDSSYTAYLYDSVLTQLGDTIAYDKAIELQAYSTYYICVEVYNTYYQSFTFSVNSVEAGSVMEAGIALSEGDNSNYYEPYAESGTVWFKFVPTEAGKYTFETDSSDCVDMELRDEGGYILTEVYDYGASVSYNLDADKTYYIKFSSPNATNANFNVNVSKVPAGYDRETAIELDSTLAYTGTYAFVENNGGEVWFKFTTPSHYTTYTITVDAQDGANLYLYYNTNNYTTTSGVDTIKYQLNSNATYYLKVVMDTIDTEFAVKVELPGQSANVAYEIPSSGTYSGTYPTINDVEDSVWFKYVTSSAGDYSFQLNEISSSVNATVSVYDSITATTPIATGSSAVAFFIEGLSGYTAYYIKVEMAESYDNGYDNSFGVIVESLTRDQPQIER